ncbi:E3 ubiquitin-protein ligase MIB2-like protein [Aphelenchoides fujianensis]|nr:E3 ubiquitin-protein ligase MIB2-like protein [Aphelenchoides fujianensis]
MSGPSFGEIKQIAKEQRASAILERFEPPPVAPPFHVGERVYAWFQRPDRVPDFYRQLGLKFVERVLDMDTCVGHVQRWEDDVKARVRFFTQLADETTVTLDLAIPCALLRKAPGRLFFVPGDLVNSLNMMAVRKPLNGEDPLKLEDMSSGVVGSFDEHEVLVLPVYAAERPWQVAQEGGQEGDRRTRLLFGRLRPKLPADLAQRVLRKTSAKRDDRLFREACASDPNFMNSAMGDTIPLVFAIRLQSPFLVTFLIACGANSKVRDRRGNSLLHIAVEDGCPKMVHALLLQIPEEANAPNLVARTPFHAACTTKRAEVIGELLASPHVDPTFRDADGNTGLHLLIALPERDEDRTACLRLFLAAKEPLRSRLMHAVNHAGLTPFQAAIEWKKWDTVELFMERLPTSGDAQIGAVDGEMTLVHALARAGHYPLFRRAADPCNGRYLTAAGGRSPLHAAVEGWTGVRDEDYARAQIVEYLIVNRRTGRELEEQDAGGNSPTHLLARVVNEMDERAPFPLAIFPAIIAAKMSTPAEMILAADWNQPLAMLCFFSACGGDFQLKNEDGETPLDAIKRAELRVLLADCAKCGVNEWMETGIRAAPTKRTCRECAGELDVRNVVYCLPCKHFFACADCRSSVPPMDACPRCDAAVRAVRVIVDGRDELLHRNDPVDRQLTPDGRLVSEVIAEMRAQIAALEDSVLCGICMEERSKVAFGCGHTACEECARLLRQKDALCHICRQTIANFITIY